MKKQMKKNKKGFTLVEMIVVIAIIGVLAAMMVPSLLGYIEKGHASNNRAAAANIGRAAAIAIAENESLKTDATNLALEMQKVLDSAKGEADIEFDAGSGDIEVKYTKNDTSPIGITIVAVTPAQSTGTYGYYPEP